MKINCPKCHRRIRIRKSKRHNKCRCGYSFLHKQSFGKGYEIYLVDTNVFIYALNKDRFRGRHCEKILTGSFPIATTGHVMDEIRRRHDYSLKIFNIKNISPEVDELRYNSLKTLSKADKSLIQCAIDYPEIVGIITNDIDIKSVVPNRLIQSESFFIGRPNEFLKKIGVL
jgi:rRNA-processing protein FCF1